MTEIALERTIELPDMVAYAGATWDWHRLHYDSAWLAERDLERPVVDGQLFGALLAEMVLDWAGPGAELTALSFRFKGFVYAGETVRCTGRVVSVEDGVTALECTVEVVGPEARVAVAPAAAEVRRP
ncbi:dehydratase [Nocardioides sp. Root1257]|uniref:MaoC/PaaZ C-terminal domain-containing protein n=1 Tax=unclassified Nocardioides TaxID=2615069 RepID=UPI0006FB781C|nr:MULTISPECIES: MaoC/PaaZ C-terminal domain-containing protein [unclassified Nocardioides]KQW53677.1 dehydratase [Nocardioides sp. Root1257]KRC56363.1 dehydratase [Nocardioides sp. Root224]